MKKILLCLIMLLALTVSVHAEELVAPAAPDDVQQLIPMEQTNFGESLWYVVRSALDSVAPDITQALQVCLTVIAAILLISMFRGFQDNARPVTELVTTVALATILLMGTNSLIHEGAKTVTRLSDYGKLFIPVMTAALASQGGVTSAGAIYAATAMFDSVLTALIGGLFVPMVYIYLALSIANSAIGEDMLKKLRDFMKWLVGWSLKTLLYIFTGYVTVTGVISGVTDATAIKAAKLTISGAVPVIGGILSDASEAILVGAGAIKNSLGVAGLLAVLAIVIGPFLRIGVHYLLLKLTAAVTSVFSDNKSAALIQDFSSAMGLLLAMTGTVCVMLLISTVCMMRGISL